ncbi:MAG: hypothetical protein KME64_19815 [Scytonematopsis contorta HA4267-MV1]|jgi:hypothetical protein|nr:hypothetical protein [Scytonematopsis contorta HA4267-MV1]
MAREVTDSDNITWSCAEAYSGLSDSEEKSDAAKVKGEDNKYWVVCTPSGGAKSVRIKLSGDWENSSSDEELLDLIAQELKAEVT